MNISRYANIDKFVNIQYIFLLARRAYSWLFQLSQMWKLLAPGIGLVDFLTPAIGRKTWSPGEILLRNKLLFCRNGVWEIL